MSLVGAISFRGCADECHAYAVSGVAVTLLAGIPFAACGGAAFVRWWRNGRLVEDLVGLRGFLVAVGALLVPFAVAGGLGVLEEVIEGVIRQSLQPPSWEVFAPRDVAWITLPELVGVAYVGGTAVAFLVGGAALRVAVPQPA